MSVQTIRGSTVDSNAGIQLVGGVDESGDGLPPPFGIQIGNKSTYSETARTGITTGDSPSSGDLSTGGFAGTGGANLFDLGNALNVAIRATCSSLSATLTGRLIFYDSSNNPLGFSIELTFTSDSTLRVSSSGNYVSSVALVDANAARKAEFFVDTVSAGTWSVYCRPV